MKEKITIIILIIFFIITTIYLSRYFEKQIIVEGVKEHNIYFGQTINMNNSTALSYSNGIVLGFQMMNRYNEMNGYKLNLFIYNDDYDKNKAVKNAKILLDYDNVLGLIGTWGTPTAYEVYDKIIGQKNIPFIAPSSGSSILKTEYDNMIMIRPSFKSEIELILDNMRKNNIKNISVIYQNDVYGISCLNDLVKLYSTNNYNINIKYASYETNSRYLSDTYKNILGADPFINSQNRTDAINNIDAVLLFTTTFEQIDVIDYFKKLKPNIFIYNISPIGENLNKLKQLKNKSNIFMTTVVKVNNNSYPVLYNTILNEVKYSNSMNKYLNVPITVTNNFIEGFIAGVFVGNIVKKMRHNNINRTAFINEVYNLEYIDVFDMKLGPFITDKESRGLHKPYIMKFNPITDKYDYIL